MEWSILELLRLSLLASLNEAILPLGQTAELLIVSHGHEKATSNAALAGYGAVLGSTTFTLSIFNFCTILSCASVSEAVGANAPEAVKRRTIWALCIAVAVGLLACGLLLLLQTPVLQDLYSLDEQVVNMSGEFYIFRTLSIPFQLLWRASCGIIQGHHRLDLLLAAQIAYTFCLVLAYLIVILVFDGGLEGLGVAFFAVNVMFSSLIVWLTLRSTWQYEAARRSEELETQENSEHLAFSLRSYVLKAGNMFLRSTLLSSTLFLMSIVASRLGKTPLAAHQIVLQLWSLTSYIVDGFADVATMVGSKLLGSKLQHKVYIPMNRLVMMSLITGILFAVIFATLENEIISAFTSNEATQVELHNVWVLVTLMQVPNSLVFAYDGVIYATQRFDIVRNIMFIGCLVWFAPAVLSVFGNSLLNLWTAKAVLNCWRAGCAFVVMHCIFYPRWHESVQPETQVDNSPLLGST